jgi:hypothetical protein
MRLGWLVLLLGVAGCAARPSAVPCLSRAVGLPPSTRSDTAALNAALRVRFPPGAPMAGLDASVAAAARRWPACRFEGTFWTTGEPGVLLGEWRPATRRGGAGVRAGPAVRFFVDSGGTHLLSAPAVAGLP